MIVEELRSHTSSLGKEDEVLLKVLEHVPLTEEMSGLARKHNLDCRGH